MTEFKTNKLEVTDEIIQVAQNAYDFAKVHPLMDRTARIRSALEAVFAMLPEAGSANNAQSEDDGWIEHDGRMQPVTDETIVVAIATKGTHSTAPLPAKYIQWQFVKRYRIIDKPEPTQDNEKWLDYTGTCHPNTGVVKMVRLKDGDVIMLGYADFDNWPDVKAYQLWSEDHEPEPEEYKRYYGHIDKDGNYTFPHDEPQKKENNLELMCDCICHGTICELCAPKPIPTLNQFRKNHSARNNELLVMSEFDYISEYLDKYMKEKD